MSKILCDLTQKQLRAQHPGARRMYFPERDPVSPDHVHQGSLNMARTWPDIDEPRPPEEGHHAVPYGPVGRFKRQQALGHRKTPNALYRPVNGHSEGRRFLLIDKLTGQVLARCQGDDQHVIGEATKLALSQNCTIADLVLKHDQDQ